MIQPMTGLRHWERDPEIPSRAGQPGLAAPSADEVEALVRAHLLLPAVSAAGGPHGDIQKVDWEYARWKPGVSLTTCHRLHFGDGTDELIVHKRYAGDKAAVLAERDLSDDPPGLSPRLHARAVLPERHTVLFAPQADRELGLRYLLDVKRFPKLLRDSGLVEPGLVRRRRTEFELLRYKPERRAVYRVRLRLRDEARTRLSMAVRVLPGRQVASTLALRRAFESQGGGILAPRVACAHPRHGLLVERWIDGLATRAPDDFTHAEQAGQQLARLHAIPLAPPIGVDENSGAPLPERPALELVPPALEEPVRHAPLFGEAPSLAQRLRALHVPRAPRPRAWVHGDFHPDQLAEASAASTGGPTRGPLLLDLDCLTQGDPALDLASWIADHLYERAGNDFADASEPLLEGYALAGGAQPDSRFLRRTVACELAARAAASMRRLERGALDRAELALGLAGDLAR